MVDLPVADEPKLDILDTGLKHPSLSTTSDMPVVETRPDASPAPAPEPDVEADGEDKDVSTAAPDPDDEDAGKTTDAQSASAPTEEETGAPEAEPKKQSRGVQKKLDELRREAEDAKRQAQSEREERLRVLTMLERQQTAPAEVNAEDAEPEKPSRADYPDDDDWDSALMEYADSKASFTAKKEIKATIEAERQRAHAASIATAQEQVRAQYQARIDKYMAEKPDFHEVAESPDVIVSKSVAHVIMHSDAGPALQYHLGSHPDEAKRIMALSPPLQLVELGKIESKLSAGQTPKPATAGDEPAPATATPAPRKISAAPKPITPLNAGDAATISKDPQSMNMDEYKAWRAKQGAQVRR